MGIALSNKAIEKYYGFLRKLDNSSKKNLIIKLTDSLEVKENKTIDLTSIFGAWEDSKDSDQINKDIREARVENRDIEELYPLI